MSRGAGQEATGIGVPTRGAGNNGTHASSPDTRTLDVSELSPSQREALALGYSSQFTWTAVIAPEPNPISSETPPAVYVVSDIPGAEPSYIDDLGRIGSSEELPEGERLKVASENLDLPRDMSGRSTTPQIIESMREWITENVSDAPKELTPHQAVDIVKERYPGGATVFIHGKGTTPSQVKAN